MNIQHKSPHRKVRVEQWRGVSLEAPFEWNQHGFQVDATSQAAIARKALVVMKRQMSGSPIQAVSWRTADNTFYRFEPQEFLDFAEAVDAHSDAVMQAGWALKDGEQPREDFSDRA